MLHDEIVSVQMEQGPAARIRKSEIIFIDDGSTDNSWRVIQSIVAASPATRGIRFRRNSGKAAALSAGFASCRGDYIVTLDGDLQDNPREIERIISELDGGCDLVCGWKKNRKDPLGKTIPSRIFNKIVSIVSGLTLHDHNCGLKGYRSATAKQLPLYGEMHRFLTLLAHSRGFRVGEIEVEHRARLFGRSKYGFKRLGRGFLDFLTIRFLTIYEQRPLHLFGGIGLLLLIAGGLGLAYLAALWLAGYRPIGTRPLLFYSIAALLFGGQCLNFGMLAELIISKFYNSELAAQNTAEVIGFDPSTDEFA